MRIIYVAKHGNLNSNQDEEAIAHALRVLGHEVETVPEFRGPWTTPPTGDLLLFHHWDNREALAAVNLPKVFWFFDLVDSPDETLRARCLHRKNWMAETIPLVNLGFCTDGDWVRQSREGEEKLVWLPQGFDERLSRHVLDKEKGESGGSEEKTIDLLLTAGYYKCGQIRRSFIDEMRKTYGSRLYHVATGYYGQDLAGLICQARIVLAPDGPGSDRYWSNRVYLTTGLGGFLLHPDSLELQQHYQHNELVCYKDRGNLHKAIAYYLDRQAERETIAQKGRERTLHDHTYRRRVAELLRVVHERLGVG